MSPLGWFPIIQALSFSLLSTIFLGVVVQVISQYKLPMQAKLMALIIFNPKINKNVGDRHQRGELYLSSVLNSLECIRDADFLPLVSHYMNEKW